MKDKILNIFILTISLILCSCDKKDEHCLSTPENKLNAHNYDKCALRGNNNPSPKREW
ncbi:hypothetical protein LQY17_003448 [Salmonella enterica]|uniref:Lipoprotein n=1 Tax=Salmonella newport TaxID=108619 RepID=A0A8E7JHS6_SALNE|nr:hypothetical protein [Salmonella enterica]EHP2152691.1 hypothetical protein [Salmonella enterica subsp. enterica serovar Panama]EIL6513812.1 hypothetical protein [Salmonella enterica subsp. enterica serovar India]EJC2388532.1 hypothetical protein [Salmonella enterica subsp. enterica serovar Muenchen]EKC6912467.1 hypothetical protein [Salmonella enterica subsp. enterica]EFT1721728.1 hypothetical protein [Salmonella enterica]